MNPYFYRSNKENSFYAPFQISSSLILSYIILTLVPHSTNILRWICSMEPHIILMIILFLFNNSAINEYVLIFSLSLSPPILFFLHNQSVNFKSLSTIKLWDFSWIRLHVPFLRRRSSVKFLKNYLIIQTLYAHYYGSIRSLSLRCAFLECFLDIGSAISRCDIKIEQHYSRRKRGKGGREERKVEPR